MNKFLHSCLLAFLLIFPFACARVDMQNSKTTINTTSTITKDFFLLNKESTVLIDFSNELNSFTPFQTSVVKMPTFGKLTLLQNGIYKFVPASSILPCRDLIEFTIINNGVSETSKIYINYLGHSNLPCSAGAQTDHLSVRTDSASQIYVLKNDFFCKPEKITSLKIISNTQKGTIVIKDDHFEFKPTLGASGEDNFIYKICDEDGNCSLSEVYVNLNPSFNPCNWRLNADNLSFTVSSDTTGSEPNLINLPIFDNDELCYDTTDWSSFKISSLPSKGSIKIEHLPSGRIKVGYVTTFPIPLEDIFQYTLCKKKGGCQTVQVHVQVKK